MYHIEVKKRKNSRKYTKVLDLDGEAAVLEYLKKKGLTATGTPYIFTHIDVSDGSIITQTDDHFGLICSPQKLRKMLGL